MCYIAKTYLETECAEEFGDPHRSCLKHTQEYWNQREDVGFKSKLKTRDVLGIRERIKEIILEKRQGF